MTIHEAAQNFHKSLVATCKGKKPGAIRSNRGKHAEYLNKQIIIDVWVKELGQSEKTIRIGPKRFKYKTIRGYRVAEVDNCIEVFDEEKWKIVACCECKSYSETPMLKRVKEDAEIVYRSTGGTVKTFLMFALERCLSDEAIFGEEDALMEFDKDLSLKVFFCCDGERSGQRPISKPEFFKPLNEEKVTKFITYMKGLLTYYAKQSVAMPTTQFFINQQNSKQPV